MITTFERLCRVLAAAAFLLLPAPASNAAESTLSPDTGVAAARALFNEGRPAEALAILRPLARSHPERTSIHFLVGLAAIETSRKPDVTETEQQALLDEAIATLRGILVDQPALVRVRLELARAFFYKREDSLAREHFERVMAGNPPPAVATNVRLFLGQIRARRRWSMYLGTALVPDSNIGASSDEEIIYIFDLPFSRTNTDELTTSGVGASVWTGGEYQHPLTNRLRLRTGADLARREHAGHRFDDMNLSVHTGPRWLVDRQTELSVLANVSRRWEGGKTDHDATGARIEARRRLTSRVTTNARASWARRDYERRNDLNGPFVDASVGSTWTISPILQAHSTIGYSRDRPRALSQRNSSRRVRVGLSAALPLGFNVGASTQVRWTDYKGSWFPFTRDGSPREDRTRSLSLSLLKRDFTLFGFSPQMVVTHEERDSSAQLHDYDRTNGELRMIRQF